METVEFNQLVEETVRRMLPRIPEQYRDGFEGIFAGGEHWMAVEDLVYALADDEVTVTADEQATLRTLVREAKCDSEVREAVDGLTVSDGDT